MSEPTLRIGEEAIAQRVRELARQISDDYAGVEQLWMIGVLKGAFIFLADLSRRVTVPRRVEFVALSSYGVDATTGPVRLLLDLRHDVVGQHLLIVEDIVDTGRTLHYLQRLLGARDPASVRSCALLRKPDRMEIDCPVDYVGFDIPDEWIVGYGLDYREQDRTLPYITTVAARGL